MGKGFICRIDKKGNYIGNSLDVYSQIMTSSIIFTGDKNAFKTFNTGDVFHYSDDDLEDWSGNFEVIFCHDNKITGKRIR